MPFAAGLKGIKVWILILLVLAMGWVLSESVLTQLLLFGCLTTIIHVYIFTILFLMVGSLKHLHFWGILNVVALILCLTGFLAPRRPRTLSMIGTALTTLMLLAVFSVVIVSLVVSPAPWRILLDSSGPTSSLIQFLQRPLAQ